MCDITCEIGILSFMLFQIDIFIILKALNNVKFCRILIATGLVIFFSKCIIILTLNITFCTQLDYIFGTGKILYNTTSYKFKYCTENAYYIV